MHSSYSFQLLTRCSSGKTPRLQKSRVQPRQKFKETVRAPSRSNRCLVDWVHCEFPTVPQKKRRGCYIHLRGMGTQHRKPPNQCLVIWVSSGVLTRYPKMGFCSWAQPSQKFKETARAPCRSNRCLVDWVH